MGCTWYIKRLFVRALRGEETAGVRRTHARLVTRNYIFIKSSNDRRSRLHMQTRRVASRRRHEALLPTARCRAEYPECGVKFWPFDGAGPRALIPLYRFGEEIPERTPTRMERVSRGDSQAWRADSIRTCCYRIPKSLLLFIFLVQLKKTLFLSTAGGSFANTHLLPNLLHLSDSLPPARFPEKNTTPPQYVS